MAKLLHAHADGTFEAQVQRGENSFVYPQLLPSCLRVCSRGAGGGVGGAADSAAPARCATFVDPPGARSSLEVPWRALCLAVVGKTARALKEHESSRRVPGSFRCLTCHQSFSCSGDLRKHKREKISWGFRYALHGSRGKEAVAPAADDYWRRCRESDDHAPSCGCPLRTKRWPTHWWRKRRSQQRLAASP